MPNEQTPLQGELYQRNIGYLQDRVLASVPPLMHEDVDRALAALSSQLREFAGSTDDEFRQWAGKLLDPAIERLKFFYELYSSSHKLVLSAIWRALDNAVEPSLYDNYSETVQELANEVWLWAFLNIEALMRKGTAKASTRIYALARKHTWFWKRKQQNRGMAMLRGFKEGLPEWLIHSQIAADEKRREEALERTAEAGW